MDVDELPQIRKLGANPPSERWLGHHRPSAMAYGCNRTAGSCVREKGMVLALDLAPRYLVREPLPY